MKRQLLFVYGIGCYVLFLGTFAYLAGFLANVLVPKSIDAPGAGFGLTALGIDTLLLVAFGVQHSVMARPGFKRWWVKRIPEPIERSTYVLFSCLLIGLLIWQWHPLGPVVWDVQHELGRNLLWGLFALGWLLVPAVSLLINHFDLFGTRQVWLHLRRQPYRQLRFRVPPVYDRIRHPLYVSWMILFWATPTMTLGHLLFAGVWTAYMLIAIPIEERDLVAAHGDAYEAYRDRVPALVPIPGRKISA